MKPDHAAIKCEQAGMIFKIDNRRCTTGDRDCTDAIWKSPGCRIAVGRTARDGENSQSLDRQIISELFDKVRPVDQSPIWVKARIANSRSVRRNNFHVEL